jgi:hypothetical protein
MIKTYEEAKQALANVRAARELRVTLYRNDEPLTLTYQIE